MTEKWARLVLHGMRHFCYSHKFCENYLRGSLVAGSCGITLLDTN